MLLLASLAHAGLRDDLRAALSGGPDATVVCSSGAEALRRMQTALDAVPNDPMPEELRALLETERGIGFSYWKEGNVFDLRFEAADEGAARAVLAGMGLEAGADGRVIGKEGNDEGTFHMVGGWASLRNNEPPTALPHEIPSTFFTHLPESDGCLIYLHLPLDQTGPLDIGMHFPFATAQPAAWSMVVPKLQDVPTLDLSGATPPRIATTAAPIAVLTLGFGVQELDLAGFLEGKDLKQARRAQRWFPVAGGTTVALFDAGSSPRFGAVIPFGRPLSARTLLRRVKTVMKEVDEVKLELVDADHYRLRTQKATFYLTAETGTVYLASDLGLLNDVQAGTGTPWVGPSLVPLAERWPFLIATAGLPPELGFSPLSRPMFLAFDIDGGVAYGLVDLPIPPADLLRLGAAAKAAGGR